MNQTLPKLLIRQVQVDDLVRLQEIRRAAFAPIFASFRALLGPELDYLTQPDRDADQARYLDSLLAADSDWAVYVAEYEGEVVGFVSFQLDPHTLIGEIGLNAVHPDWAGRGIGTAMYEFAIEQMRVAGMRVATVSTGGDASHAPARRAYEKAGFQVGFPSIWLCQKL